MGEKGEFAIDLNDDVVRGSIVLQDGKMMWPPPAIEMPAPTPPKKAAIVKAAEQTPFAAAVSESGLTTGISIAWVASNLKTREEYTLLNDALLQTRRRGRVEGNLGR